MTYSVLAIQLVVTLCICPLIVGLDRKISSEDLRRGLQRISDESPGSQGGPPEIVNDVIECAEKTCDETTKQLIIREILIRNQYKDFDEACSSCNDEKLLFVTFLPYAVEDEPYGENYLKWQDKVLDSGKIFCDPFKNLFCSSEKKCACGPGKKWKKRATPLPGVIFVDRPVFTVDTCIIPPGGACTNRRPVLPRYYNPLLSPMLGVFTVSPDVATCERYKPEQDNLNNGCTQKDDYFIGSICLTDDLAKTLKSLEKYFKESAKVLGVGDTCDSDAHTQLYKSEALDADKFNARLNALESIQKSGIGFCNVQKFLTCGNSGKCECTDPTMMVEGVNCTLPPEMRICGDNPAVKAMIMNNGFVPQAQRQLAQGIENLVGMDGCGEKFKCYMDLPNADDPNDIEMFCICRGFFTGENCNETLTLFLPFTRPSSLPSDAKDTAGEAFIA